MAVLQLMTRWALPISSSSIILCNWNSIIWHARYHCWSRLCIDYHWHSTTPLDWVAITKFKTIKITCNSESFLWLFTNISTPKNCPPYGFQYLSWYNLCIMYCAWNVLQNLGTHQSTKTDSVKDSGQRHCLLFLHLSSVRLARDATAGFHLSTLFFDGRIESTDMWPS